MERTRDRVDGLGFGSWEELTAALRPKSLKGRKVKREHAKKQRNANLRNRRRKRDEARAGKAFVKRAVDGKATLARPGARERLAGANEARKGGEPGRWFGLLQAMGERDWTMGDLCKAFERPMTITQAVVMRCMVERGFVERRANPTPRFYPIAGGMAKGALRPGGDRWLYRRTDLGAGVVGGAEWRKPYVYKRWKYRNARLAREAGSRYASRLV